MSTEQQLNEIIEQNETIISQNKMIIDYLINIKDINSEIGGETLEKLNQLLRSTQ